MPGGQDVKTLDIALDTTFSNQRFGIAAKRIVVGQFDGPIKIRLNGIGNDVINIVRPGKIVDCDEIITEIFVTNESAVANGIVQLVLSLDTCVDFECATSAATPSREVMSRLMGAAGGAGAAIIAETATVGSVAFVAGTTATFNTAMDTTNNILVPTAAMTAALSNQVAGVVVAQKGHMINPFVGTIANPVYRKGYALYMRATIFRTINTAGEHETVLGLVDTNTSITLEGFYGFMTDEDDTTQWYARIRGAVGVNGIVVDEALGVSPTEPHELEFRIGVTLSGEAAMVWLVDGEEVFRYQIPVGTLVLSDYGFATSGYFNSSPRICVQKRATSGAAVDVKAAPAAPMDWGYISGDF